MADNPILTTSPFPLFDQIKAEDVVPGLTYLIDDLSSDIDALESNVTPTWSGLVEPLERIADKLSRAWGAVSHLKAVKDTEPLRNAVEEVLPKRVELTSRLSQSRPIYEAFRTMRDSPEYDSFSEAQKRVVESELRDFINGGVSLEGDAKTRFNEIQQELTKLSTKFSNNVLDATKAWSKRITEKDAVDGLPPSALALAAQQAKAKGDADATAEAGPWLFTLDFPSYMPIMSHSKNRDLRQEVYTAFITRASSGDTDNGPIISKVLALRKEKAALLGFSSFAELSMSRKMATLDAAEELLEQLRVASFGAAERELAEVRAFAAEQGCDYELLHWDIGYWAERLREATFDINDEVLRPYFALPAVLEGLFGLAGRLFGVSVEAADGDAPVWHPDVRFFKLSLGGKPKAFFYLDPYSRPEEKRGGAWMDDVAGQSKLFAPEGQDVRLPVAHMVCNQTPPIGDDPSLMTFREVETLFHEFGHALQHMLTTQKEGMCAGIRGVEWDAVELPSQFMENWCYHRDTLNTFARHHQTGELLPDELYEKMVAARTFRAGSMTLRQVHFSLIDLELHARFDPDNEAGETIKDRERQLAQSTMVLPPLEEDSFLCAFAHIFAGGYSAGYYSYKWAEVLSADAFSAFEEAGLDDADKVADIGQKFRDTVLSMGGGRDPADVFSDFRGRAPSSEPLLRHSGLATAA